MARALKFPELFRAEVFPVHLSFPWGLCVGPFPHIMLPSFMRYRIGKPISTQGLDPERPEDANRLDEEVRASLQADLDHLRATEPSLSDRMQQFAKGAACLRRLKLPPIV